MIGKMAIIQSTANVVVFLHFKWLTFLQFNMSGPIGDRLGRPICFPITGTSKTNSCNLFQKVKLSYILDSLHVK